MSADLTVRHARPSEAETIAELINDAYGRTEAESGWTSEDDILAGPRVVEADVRGIVDGEGSMLVAELDGRDGPIGCAHVHELEPGAAEIGMLSVDPQLQAKGLGRALLAQAEDHAQAEHGAERIVLHVLTVREELLDWYECRGYERTGETQTFEPEEPQRSLVGELAFEVLEKGVG